MVPYHIVILLMNPQKTFRSYGTDAIFFWKYSMTMRPLIVCRAFAILGISVMFLNSKKEVTIGPRETSMIELIANIVNS